MSKYVKVTKKPKIFSICIKCGNGFITTDKSAKRCLFCTPDVPRVRNPRQTKVYKVEQIKPLIVEPKIVKPVIAPIIEPKRIPTKEEIYAPRVKRKHHTKDRVNSVLQTRRFIIFERDEFRCVYCGKSSIENKTELHLEHIHPRSKGGTNNIDNIITSCNTCNGEKGDMKIKPNILNRLRNELIKRNEVFFKGYDVEKLTIDLDRYYKVTKTETD